MVKKVTQTELLEAYRSALVRWGSYSVITIDAVSRDWCGEICIHCDGELRFQGTVQQFQKSSVHFLD